MTEYLGSDKNIQRIVRRFWDKYLEYKPELENSVLRGELPIIVKCLAIAFSEELKDMVTSDILTGELLIDDMISSVLNPMPYDNEA